MKELTKMEEGVHLLVAIIVLRTWRVEHQWWRFKLVGGGFSDCERPGIDVRAPEQIQERKQRIHQVG